MAKVICEREDLVNIADAVRSKSGTTGEMTLEEIATSVENISGSGDNSLARQIIDGSVTEVVDDQVSAVKAYCFYNCIQLTNIDLPNCTTIGSSAFYNCNQLTNINLPNCTTIGSDVFKACAFLTSIVLPNCTTIGNGAFIGCVHLTSIVLPNCTAIGSGVFYGCNRELSIYLTGSTVCDISSNSFSTGTGSFSKPKAIYVPGQLRGQYISFNLGTLGPLFKAYYEEDASRPVIVFYIDDVQYSADEAMTLTEWSHSSYNTGGFIVRETSMGNFYMYDSEGTMILKNTSTFQPDTTVLYGGERFYRDTSSGGVGAPE